MGGKGSSKSPGYGGKGKGSTKSPGYGGKGSTTSPSYASMDEGDTDEGAILSADDTVEIICEVALGEPSDIAASNYPDTIGGGSKPVARDDGYTSVLVGGNLTIEAGAEIEGKVVVLGNFNVLGGSGFSNVGAVGAGSQVAPSDDADILSVGGNVKMDKQVIFTHGGLEGNIVYRGQDLGSYQISEWEWEYSIRHEPDLDLSFYENVFTTLEKVSALYKDLPSNGIKTKSGTTATFSAGDDNCIQVFDIGAFEFTKNGWLFEFDDNLTEKTIIFNVDANDLGKSTVKNIANFYAPDGSNHFKFNRKMLGNILWNFPDTLDLNMGKWGCESCGEFIGTVLAPNALSTYFAFPGHSGRFIVNGDLTFDRAGSEFHNFPFSPTCPMPTIDECPTPCGPNMCGSGEECCNESCGICVPKGGSCTQEHCDPVQTFYGEVATSDLGKNTGGKVCVDNGVKCMGLSPGCTGTASQELANPPFSAGEQLYCRPGGDTSMLVCIKVLETDGDFGVKLQIGCDSHDENLCPTDETDKIDDSGVSFSHVFMKGGAVCNSEGVSPQNCQLGGGSQEGKLYTWKDADGNPGGSSDTPAWFYTSKKNLNQPGLGRYAISHIDMCVEDLNGSSSTAAAEDEEKNGKKRKLDEENAARPFNWLNFGGE